jgi:hypothetical protein
MTTRDLEYWKDHFRGEGRLEGQREGHLEGLRHSLLTVYRARFGEPGPEVTGAIESTRDASTLERWLSVLTTGSRDEITAALRTNGTPS